MADYFIGLDAGNTMIKAVLFDDAGREMALSRRNSRTRMPKQGHVERNMDEMWADVAQVVRDCIEQAGIDAGKIAGVGCAGHGNGLYTLDRAGRPLLA